MSNIIDFDQVYLPALERRVFASGEVRTLRQTRELGRATISLSVRCQEIAERYALEIQEVLDDPVWGRLRHENDGLFTQAEALVEALLDESLELSYAAFEIGEIAGARFRAPMSGHGPAANDR